MFGADATIAWVDQNGMAQAQDYYLNGYVQVSFHIVHCMYDCIKSNVYLINLGVYNFSVAVAQGRVPIQSILPVAHHVAMMSLMCLVLYKRDNNVSPSQDLSILVRMS